MEATLSKFMGESAKRHEENSNLIKEIQASTDAGIRNQGASIKTLEIQIGQMSKVLQERGFGNLPSSTEANPRDQVKSILTTIEADSYPIRHMLEDIKVPLILERPFLSTARAKIDVYKGEERIANWEETLVLNRSLDHFLEDYIELNDLNKPFELRRNKGDDLIPTNKEGEVIEEFRTRDDELDIGIDDYPSYCDYDKKSPIDFLEDMDAYRDEGMSDVIFSEPFLREVGIKTKRFEGIITIYNGDDEVTYQIVLSHPRFKHHTNEQCNKIPPLLKVSKNDDVNGISHACQKLKRFYKGVLNLGPDYIRDAKTEE
ncbi:hypothetical protein Tco_0880930 [Tanacetum coccineum]